ncbi:MAG: hypothetical protein HFE88_02085 [Acutalibacter sp.]|nr:hypothetical protein [Acutalibacter sp.]MCI8920657.1 hypothetical protein [Acutalibacter sp.]
MSYGNRHTIPESAQKEMKRQPFVPSIVPFSVFFTPVSSLRPPEDAKYFPYYTNFRGFLQALESLSKNYSPEKKSPKMACFPAVRHGVKLSNKKPHVSRVVFQGCFILKNFSSKA